MHMSSLCKRKWQRIANCTHSHSLILSILISFPSPESVAITPKDARWVGAWWLGFLVSSAFLLLSSVPFWFLPRSLPMHEGEQNRRENVSGTSEALGSNHSLKLTDIAKGFFKLLWNLELWIFILILFKGPILYATLLCLTILFASTVSMSSTFQKVDAQTGSPGNQPFVMSFRSLIDRDNTLSHCFFFHSLPMFELSEKHCSCQEDKA